jgi:TIR domain
MNVTPSESYEIGRDFFISYTGVDQQWAQWIAWELEQAGHTTILQAWDFEPGSHFVSEMHRATQVAQRTIAILSHAYLQSGYAEAEWQEAWRADPTGTQRKLIVFRIEDCPRPGLLGQLVSEDLFGTDIDTARVRLLAAVRRVRRKPALPPDFPVQEPPARAPRFPGRLIPSSLDEAIALGGPMTRDNPYAVALAFWHAVLDDDYGRLDNLITPESRGHWDLEEIRDRTENSGIATGVSKPSYDVAHVKVIADVISAGVPLQVEGGPMLVEARIVSLVLRPELGGWRVHEFGLPLEPDQLPRTWREA